MPMTVRATGDGFRATGGGFRATGGGFGATGGWDGVLRPAGAARGRGCPPPGAGSPAAAAP
eukprot:6849687-Pyramimonas_sp.AAC.1